MVDIVNLYTQFIQFINSLFPGLKINLLDIIIVVIVVYYSIEGYALGFVLAFFDLLSFIISFFLALKYYFVIASLLVEYSNLHIGFAYALGFFIIAFFSEIFINIFFRYAVGFIPRLPIRHKSIRGFLSGLNHFLGVVPGIASALLVLAFLLTVIVSLPSSPLIKRLVTGSEIGSVLIANTSMFER